MRDIRLTILITLIIILSFSTIKNYFVSNHSNDLNNEGKTLLKESVRVLNDCFDLQNKNKRSLKNSIELIEFCLEEYGYKK